MYSRGLPLMGQPLLHGAAPAIWDNPWGWGMGCVWGAGVAGVVARMAGVVARTAATVPGGGGGQDGGEVAGTVGALGWAGMARAVGKWVVATDPATPPSWPPAPPFWPSPPPRAVLATTPT